MAIGPDFDGISIVTDESNGLCNVYIHQGDEATSLFSNCSGIYPGEFKVTYYLPKETPLVGFHGHEIEDDILAFGLILLNTLDPMC